MSAASKELLDLEWEFEAPQWVDLEKEGDALADSWFDVQTEIGSSDRKSRVITSPKPQITEREHMPRWNTVRRIPQVSWMKQTRRDENLTGNSLPARKTEAPKQNGHPETSDSFQFYQRFRALTRW
jgi:hypothetical protein